MLLFLKININYLNDLQREPFCQDTGFREQVSCVVIDTKKLNNMPIGQPIIAGKESLDHMVRIHYQSCSVTAAQAKTFISFEVSLLITHLLYISTIFYINWQN